MTNSYSVPLEYLLHSDSHSNFEFEGKIKFISVTLLKSLSLTKTLHLKTNCELNS